MKVGTVHIAIKHMLFLPLTDTLACVLLGGLSFLLCTAPIVEQICTGSTGRIGVSRPIETRDFHAIIKCVTQPRFDTGPICSQPLACPVVGVWNEDLHWAGPCLTGSSPPPGPWFQACGDLRPNECLRGRSSCLQVAHMDSGWIMDVISNAPTIRVLQLPVSNL